jgi:hypothetical protein
MVVQRQLFFLQKCSFKRWVENKNCQAFFHVSVLVPWSNDIILSCYILSSRIRYSSPNLYISLIGLCYSFTWSPSASYYRSVFCFSTPFIGAPICLIHECTELRIRYYIYSKLDFIINIARHKSELYNGNC